MTKATWILPVTACLVLTVLSGCIDEASSEVEDPVCPEAGCPDDDLISEDGRDLTTGLTANDTIQTPQWELGQSFGQHIFDGPDDTTGYHIDSMVVEDTGDAWVIATNDEELARRDAYWDYPFLGSFQKSDLSTSGYGLDWDFLFEFPLEHGKTWERTITLPHSSFFWDQTYEVAFEVAFAPVVETFEGPFPGFQITGTTGGETLFTYAYVPKIGWYDQFYWYDLESDDPEDYRMKAISMGTGTNWTGTYYVAETIQSLEHMNIFCAFIVEPWCQPTEPDGSFTLQDEANRLFGVVVTGAWGGHARTVVQPPEGPTRAYEHTNSEVPDPEGEPDFENAIKLVWVDEPVIPGDWTVSGAGAGFMWGTYYNLKEISMVEGTLGGTA